MEKLMMKKDDTSSKKTHLARVFAVTHGSRCYMHLWGAVRVSVPQVRSGPSTGSQSLRQSGSVSAAVTSSTP